MITVFYCTRKSKPSHSSHLEKTIGVPGAQIIEYINDGESLTKCYNIGLEQAKHDIVVFCHDDIILETKNWGAKLLKHYKKNPEHGILGVAGSKYLADTGKWWQDSRTMYGWVAHTHEGKTWLNKYSDDQQNRLEDVVTVDGVFFSVHKGRISKKFDESVEGFHFYDIDFSFRNYLDGVKVGVHTNIRVNHMSIGETNEEWEQNRMDFAEKFKDNLPAKINKVFKPGHKFRVLIGCLSFQNLTGSELHVFELARQLIKKGCEVTVCSTCGGEIARRAKAAGIKMANIQEPPGYKLGDGTWTMQTPEGQTVTSQEGALYRMSAAPFDIMHLNHKPIAEHLIQLYPELEAVSTIHSEVIALEHPVIHPHIKKYITIRPEIQDFIVEEFDIPRENTDVIYNPIDQNRFKPAPPTKKRDKKRTLFVGTIDYLRKETILDLINKTKEEDGELWIVGKENDVKISELIDGHDHVSYFEPTWNVEKYIRECDETAGILLGRTTIEGWLCGKPGWIYDINQMGEIENKELYPVPEDVDKFKGEVIADQIIEHYKTVLQ